MSGNCLCEVGPHLQQIILFKNSFIVNITTNRGRAYFILPCTSLLGNRRDNNHYNTYKLGTID